MIGKRRSLIVIRHHDMPQRVFNLLWDTIQLGRGIGDASSQIQVEFDAINDAARRLAARSVAMLHRYPRRLPV